MMDKWIPTTDSKLLRRLGKLLEELGELQAVAARCITQGINEIDPASGEINNNRLHKELADVLAQIECCIQILRLNRNFIDIRRDVKIGQMAEWESHFDDPRS